MKIIALAGLLASANGLACIRESKTKTTECPYNWDARLLGLHALCCGKVGSPDGVCYRPQVLADLRLGTVAMGCA